MGFAAERCKLKQFSAAWRRDDWRSGGASSSGFLIINWNCRSEVEQSRGMRRERDTKEQKMTSFLSICMCITVLLNSTFEHPASCLREFIKAEMFAAAVSVWVWELKSGSHASHCSSFASFSKPLFTFLWNCSLCAHVCVCVVFLQMSCWSASERSPCLPVEGEGG